MRPPRRPSRKTIKAFRNGRIGSRTDHDQRKEPHDNGTEQAAAEELGDAPLARLAREHDTLVDDGAQPERGQGSSPMRRVCA
jgi:hypothetical protein